MRTRSICLGVALILLSPLAFGQWVRTNGPCNANINALAVIETNLFAGTWDFLGSPGPLYLSTDAGKGWAAVNSPLPNWYVTSLAVNGTHLFAGGFGVAHSTDNGTTWTIVNAGLTDKTVFCLAVNGAKLYAGSYRNVFVSTDNGSNWTLSLPTHHEVISLAVRGGSVFASTRSGYNGWGSMWGSAVYRLVDNDTIWTRADSGLPGLSALAPLGVCGTRLFVDTSPVLVAPPPPSTDESSVYCSADDGATWTTADSGLPYLVTCFAASGMNLFAGTQHGVYRTTDNGISWTEANSGLMDMHVVSLVANQTYLFAGTDSGGVWRRPLAELTTSVEPGTSQKPAEFSLDQNYPNPFNPSTTIEYELPKSSDVRLSVCDMLGREVSVLVNERKDAGVHEVRFDGSGLSSGMYVYRLQAGNFVQTRKLLLLK